MGEWVLIWMIFQSELGTTIIAPPPIYFHFWTSGRSDPIQKTLKRGATIRGIQAAIAAAL